MSIEDRVLALIEEGNPMPDPNEIQKLPAPPATYLRTIRRGSEIPGEPAREAKTARQAPSWLAASAAAGVVLVVGLLTLLFYQAQPEAPPFTNPAPSTTAPVFPLDPTGYWVAEEVRQLALLDDGTYSWSSGGTVSDAGRWRVSLDRLVFTSSADSVNCPDLSVGIHELAMPDADTLTLSFGTDDCSEDRGIAPLVGSRTFERSAPFERTEPEPAGAWESLPDDRSAVGPEGTYRTFLFSPEFKITLDRGWGRTSPSGRSQIVAFGTEAISRWCCPNTFADASPEIILVSRPGESPEDLVDALVQSRLLDIPETTTSRIGGAPGNELSGRVVGTYTIYNVDGNTFSLPRDYFFTMWVVAVAEQPVVVILTSDTEKRLDSLRSDAQSMLDSIVWRDLGDE